MGRSIRSRGDPEERARKESGELVRGAWDGAYRSLTGTSTRLCALTVDGRVECDREWPFLKP
jgi:hypothetical protein